MQIQMTGLDPYKIEAFGFYENCYCYYVKEIHQDFHGKYYLHVANDEIFGTFTGFAVQRLELNEFISKLSFRSPDAAKGVEDLLREMKASGAIDYEEI